MVRLVLLIVLVLVVPGGAGFVPKEAVASSGYLIVGNADMMSHASANGWPGTGTASDPIVIQDLIATVTFGDAFAVEDVSLHFHVINAMLTGPGQADPGAGTGVRLVSTPNALVRDSTISGFAAGGYTSAFGVQFHNNTLTANGVGIRLQTGSTGLLGNMIESGGAGIVQIGGSATMTNNVVRSNDGLGIQISGTSGSVVEDNQITDNGGVGIYVFDSNFVSVVSNTIARNGNDGIQFIGGSASQNTGHRVAGNTLADNGRFGLLISNSPSQLAWGIHRGVMVSANTVTGHENGIRLIDTRLMTLSSNHVAENTVGVTVVGGGTGTLRGNTIADNHRGLLLQGSSGNQVKANVLTGNWLGIELDGGSAGNTVLNNIFDNTINAHLDDATPNVWSLPKRPGSSATGGTWEGGNSWSDYKGRDRDGDGLGEEPYRVDRKLWAVDAHPLT